MPCMKCSNGKYKYGERGRCQFDTLEACKAAEAAIHARERKQASEPVDVFKEITELNTRYLESLGKILS
jgi:hypothetical protein